MARENKSGVGVQNVEELVEFFGTQAEVARAFGVSRAHVNQAYRAAQRRKNRAEEAKMRRELLDIGIDPDEFLDSNDASE